MKTRNNSLILWITSKAKRFFFDYLTSPYQTKIIEMILTIIDFVNAMLSLFG